jgi:hypothetical protein
MTLTRHSSTDERRPTFIDNHVLIQRLRSVLWEATHWRQAARCRSVSSLQAAAVRHRLNGFRISFYLTRSWKQGQNKSFLCILPPACNGRLFRSVLLKRIFGQQYTKRLYHRCVAMSYKARDGFTHDPKQWHSDIALNQWAYCNTVLLLRKHSDYVWINAYIGQILPLIYEERFAWPHYKSFEVGNNKKPLVANAIS